MDNKIYELIKNKANYSHWAGDYPFLTLENEKYYKIPIENPKLVYKTEGYYHKLNKIHKDGYKIETMTFKDRECIVLTSIEDRIPPVEDKKEEN